MTAADHSHRGDGIAHLRASPARRTRLDHVTLLALPPDKFYNSPGSQRALMSARGTSARWGGKWRSGRWWAALMLSNLTKSLYAIFDEAIPMGRGFEVRKESMAKTAGQKSKLYSKYGRQLYMVAKNGGADPSGNPGLRSLIEKAKREQVPSHVIEKALDKASGSGSENFTPARYEGFGPSGCSIIIDCLTDNNNRTITDVRNCFTKTGFKLGAPGSVAHLFDHFAILAFKGNNSEQVLESMLAADVDVSDVESENGHVTVFAPAAEFYKAKQALLETFPDIELEVDEITFVPQSRVEIATEDLPMFEKFIHMLNDCDDVQDIYHNALLPR